MKKKILKDEIRKEDLDTDEKILNYFRGYFSLFPVSAINAKLTFTNKFGIVLSNNLSKKIGGIASYITIKEKDKRSIKEKILDLVDNNNNKISKEYSYTIKKSDGSDTEKSFIVICNNNMLENIHKNSIRSFHFDCTYKCVPPTPNKYRLLVLSGYDNISKKTVLCCFILCEYEKSITFENIFKILKNEPYYFDPYYLMCDFAKGQIIDANKIFPNSLLNCCFFHFSQIIWRKFKFYGMTGKGNYEFNSTLLSNIQLLCFIKPEWVNYFFNKIRKKFEVNLLFIIF